MTPKTPTRTSRPGRTRWHHREPLTADEVSRLEAALQAPAERLVVWTLLDTGLRLGELVGLTRAAIDWQAHRLVIHGKGRVRRIVPLSRRVQALLEHHYALSDRFPLSRRSVQRVLRGVANRAGIARPVSPHVLRHTFAVTCLQRGISLAALQQLLGHADLATTAVYLHLSPEEALREYRERW